MIEVKRYMENCGEGGGVFEHRNGDLVLLKDFDRVTAERDAALGRELQSRNDLAKSLADHFRKNAEISALQQRLTAADERADVLEGLLREALPSLDLAASTFKAAKPVRNKMRAALKPAEVKCGVCGQGALACSDGGCHYLEDGNGEP